MDYEYIQVTTDGNVGILTLNRPKVLNALNLKLVDELVDAMEWMDRQESIRVIVVHGNALSFAAGADRGNG